MRRLAISLAILLSAAPVSAQGTRLTPIADVTVTGSATTLRAANQQRTSLVCVNNDAAVNVRIGDSTVAAATGVRLRPGASITITGSEAVSAISEGANVVVSCSEETR